MRAVRFLRYIILIAILPSSYFVWREVNDMTPIWIDTAARKTGLSGEILFVAGGALCTALGLPRQTICFLGGYAFGPAKGSILALVASIGGCMGSFAYARLLGGTVLLTHFTERMPDTFLRRHPFSMALVIRLLPIGNNLLTNMAAGISGVKMIAFVAGSTVGYVPQTIIFALLGSGLQINHLSYISLSVMLLIFSSLIGAWILHRYDGLPPPR